ncbi:MAG: hemolysin family protein [Candidatus Alcyoniella australis]|nr:hemolysin family protein [Candidatus Alcyoniella australis]
MADEDDSFIVRFRRLIKGRMPDQGDAQQQIERLLEQVEEQGLISPSENDLLSSVLDFSDTRVAEIMVPRPEITGVSLDEPLSNAIRSLIESGHTRLPAFRDDLDHIEGLLYAKDLLRCWGRSDDEVELELLLREPYFIPESKRIEELLREFQKQRLHIAIVIDEYGGTAGLVTLEDIIEEVFGEIEDEYDDSENEPQRTADGWVVVNPRFELGELDQLFPDVEHPQGDFTTLGGWILEVTGRIPDKGESVRLGPLRAVVLESDEKRIIKIKIKPDLSGDK